jgi:hypothetical protein
MTKTTKIAGGQARPYVQAKKAFRNHNNQLFARWEAPLLYVVYSYGDHWPLWVWDGFDWYENEDKYSPTTTKHRSQTNPFTPTTKVSRTWLRTMIANRKNNNAQMERVQSSLMAA